MSVNTVRKAVATLEKRGLIITESTAITTKDGRKYNSSLLYTIRPIREVLDLHNQQLLRQLELDAQHRRTLEHQEEYSRRHPTVALCIVSTTGTHPRRADLCVAVRGRLRGMKGKAAG